MALREEAQQIPAQVDSCVPLSAEEVLQLLREHPQRLRFVRDAVAAGQEQRVRNGRRQNGVVRKPTPVFE